MLRWREETSIIKQEETTSRQPVMLDLETCCRKSRCATLRVSVSAHTAFPMTRERKFGNVSRKSLKSNKPKANFAENGIHRLRVRMSRQLRNDLSRNWVRAAETAVKKCEKFSLMPLFNYCFWSLNQTPNPATGSVKPSDIYSPLQNPFLTMSRRYKSPSVEQQIRNQKAYEAKKGKEPQKALWPDLVSSEASDHTAFLRASWV